MVVFFPAAWPIREDHVETARTPSRRSLWSPRVCVCVWVKDWTSDILFILVEDRCTGSCSHHSCSDVSHVCVWAVCVCVCVCVRVSFYHFLCDALQQIITLMCVRWFSSNGSAESQMVQVHDSWINAHLSAREVCVCVCVWVCAWACACAWACVCVCDPCRHDSDVAGHEEELQAAL